MTSLSPALPAPLEEVRGLRRPRELVPSSGCGEKAEP